MSSEPKPYDSYPPNIPYEHLNEDLEEVLIDERFTENHLEELLELFSHIFGVGQHYDETMLLQQQRFGSQFQDMWMQSRALINRSSGKILSVLLASTTSSGDIFRKRIATDSGLDPGDTRLYISELVTQLGDDTRKKGYATYMLESSIERAHADGIGVVTLVTELSERNQDVLNFYNRRGFKAYGLQDPDPLLVDGNQTVFLYRLTDV